MVNDLKKKRAAFALFCAVLITACASDPETTIEEIFENPRAFSLNTEVDTASTASICDGANVDCHTECAPCGLGTAECKPMLEDCMSSVKCAAFYECLTMECYDPSGIPLEKEEWSDCSVKCIRQTGADFNAVIQWFLLQRCIGCNICPTSCSDEFDFDFPNCGPTS